MAKRMILMLTVTMAVLAVLGFLKFQQFQAAASQAAGFQPPPAAVTTIVAQPEQWPDTLAVIGTTAAVQGVTVGRQVRITTEDLSGVEFTGRVTALDSVVSHETRNVQVQDTVPNPDGKL